MVLFTFEVLCFAYGRAIGFRVWGIRVQGFGSIGVKGWEVRVRVGVWFISISDSFKLIMPRNRQHFTKRQVFAFIKLS